MHETSLGGTLRDYLTGEEIDETTYEEFRQALAKLLVEDKGYPKANLKAKVDLDYEIDGETFTRTMDLVAYDDEGRPLAVFLFCAGDIGSYERETLCVTRLMPGGPAPYGIATDTLQASLMDEATGRCVASGMDAVPDWERLNQMAADYERTELSSERRKKIERIFHTYNGFLFGTCCSDSCTPS